VGFANPQRFGEGKVEPVGEEQALDQRGVPVMTLSPEGEGFLKTLRDQSQKVRYAEIPWGLFKELFSYFSCLYPTRLPLSQELPDGRMGLMVYGVPVAAHKEEGWWAFHLDVDGDVAR
jgi:hypothetical protein